MKLLGTLGLGTLVAGVGLAYCVREQSLRTGDGYLATLRRLPAQVRPLLGDVRRRIDLAVSEGRQAARLREAQVQQQLTATGSSPAAA
ncbi:MAG TPA: hypothetical protein VJ787_01995 [Thermoleophilia bacterium]|nr:hypothetical protein [Thermoleophilia bacterium]